MFTRRRLLLGSAVAAAAAAIARPTDRGGVYSPYFAQLNAMLRAHRIYQPVLLIDLDRLDRNIDRVAASAAVAPARTYRVVVKSIPSPGLVDYVARRAGTRALMSFHRPFLEAMARLRPDADILLGKPMPVDAARTFYAGLAPGSGFDPARQLQWLIDTDARLAQYRSLAQERGVRMRINLEIDVGLRRGGFASPEEAAGALQTIAGDPEHLEFAGFMGYDAHLMGLPETLAKAELPRVKARYSAFVTMLRERFPALAQGPLCFNAAGSPTFRHYEGDAVVNDISAGTCLMLPTHYDLPILADFEPSAFIASPVLKRLQGGRLPAMEWAGPLLRGWDPNHAQIYFAYGGNWMAECVSPPGLAPHFAYASSNQQGYMASRAVGLAVDDFIFLRPVQSEAVLLQFGDLVAFRGDRIIERWPVLTQSV